MRTVANLDVMTVAQMAVLKAALLVDSMVVTMARSTAVSWALWMAAQSVVHWVALKVGQKVDSKVVNSADMMAVNWVVLTEHSRVECLVY